MSGISIPKSIEAFLSASRSTETPDVPFLLPENQSTTHKLTLRRGRAKNFRAIGNSFIEIDYQRNQSTLITSDDNGAGKSTMAVWLPFFVFFNTPYSKKEVKSGLVNSTTKKDCVGEIEFFTKGFEWKISRGIKPDFIHIHILEDGVWKKLENDAGKNDVNKQIVDLIGLDVKLFENMVVLGKDKYEPFIEMSAGERRHIVESIWDLGLFSVMNEEAKADFKKAKENLNEENHKRDLYLTQLTNAKNVYQQVVDSNSTITEINQTTHDNLVLEYNADDAVITTEQDNLEKYDSELSLLTTKIDSGEAEVNKELAAQNELVQSCLDTRIKEIDASHSREYQQIESEMDSINRDIEESQKEMVLIKEGIAEWNKYISGLESEKKKFENQIFMGNKFIQKFEIEAENVRQTIAGFEDMCQCPTCSQKVTDDAKKLLTGELYKKLEELEEKITKGKAQIESIQTSIDGLEEKAQDIAMVELSICNGNLVGQEKIIADQMDKKAEIAQRMFQHNADVEAKKNEAKTEARFAVQSNHDWARSQIELKNTALVSIRDNLRQTIRSCEDKICSLKENNTRRQKRIKELAELISKDPVDLAPYQKDVDDAKLRYDTTEASIVEYNNHLQDIEDVLFFLKDDQSKARIISLYLPYLNMKINEYLEGMNMFIGISVDDKFNIKLTSPERKGQTLFSLSDGQRARLNLAITFALSDIGNLKASVQVNMLVLDEILENMSERGVQETIEMINTKFADRNVIVISQREQEFKEYFEHNIRYGLRDGFTTVIN